MLANRHKQLGRGTGFGIGEPGDKQFTISAAHCHAVCIPTLDDRAGESDSLIAFAQNQRNEIRDLGEKAGCIQAEPGMKQQTFIVENIEVQAGQGYPCAMVPYTLKIRSGCEGGGKDATNLVLEEKPIILDRAFFNQGKNAKYDPQYYTDGICPTLVARGPAAVQARYLVRRLTPTECARLQGFPDLWGHPDYKENLTDEEFQFWLAVRNTHAAINGKQTKEYTKPQILTWYNKLHTDSSEYKMWGNGIALPNALYVMQGIAAEAEIPINLF